MHNNQCVHYKVDAKSLRLGVPVEHLEKHDIKVVRPIETIEEMNRYSQGTERLACNPPNIIKVPPRKQYPEIKVKPEIYQQILVGKQVKFSSQKIGKLAGKTFRIINQETGSYVLRTLYVTADDKGYWWS